MELEERIYYLRKLLKKEQKEVKNETDKHHISGGLDVLNTLEDLERMRNIKNKLER